MTPNNRSGTRSAKHLKTLLTPRDMAILRSVREHRYLTTRHIYQLHFSAHASYTSGIRACTRVLGRLQEHRLLHRLDRSIGGLGGGSSSTIWDLDAAADRVLREGSDDKRIRRLEPTVMFLAHTLAIADARVELVELARTGAVELISATTEPNNWRPFVGRGGGSETLKPDLHVLTAHGEWEDSWFLEIDRDTESLPTLLRKCHVYQRYYASGVEQATQGVFPTVAWLVPGERRRSRLQAAISTDKSLDDRLFRIADPGGLTALIAPIPINLESLDSGKEDTYERTSQSA